MMRFSKTIAALLTVFMIFTIMPTTIFAVANPTISVESVTDAPGGTVNVAVKINGNPGILGATLKFTYDNGLTLTGATAGDAFSALAMTKPGKFVSPCNFVWDGMDLEPSDIKDGTILTLQFAIDENAQSGDEYNVKVSYDDGDILDSNMNAVDVRLKSGTVSVVDYVPGDLNGDKKVNSGDIILLRRHIAGNYEQTINESAANVNGDDKINTADIILIRRFVADGSKCNPDGYNVTLLPAPKKQQQCNHNMTKTEYLAPTCTENGNIAYWHCSVCGKYFGNIDGTTEINQADLNLSATGHTVVIDEAVAPTYENSGLTEGKHCSVCGAVIIEQELIPPLQKDEYSITYYINNNDNYLKTINIENTNPSTYTKEDGLTLQDLYVDGYNFIGWFTAQTGGTQISEIAKGTTGNKTLYAHWEKISYTVQLACDIVPQSVISYTTDSGSVLPKPTLDKYTFVGWSDEDGNIWDNVPKGTTGNFALYANWASNRNKAEAVKSLGEPIVCEDSENGLILFGYEIGTIKNVPLYTTLQLQCANGLISTFKVEEQDTISETNAKTVAEKVSTATTNSSSWTLSSDWNNTTQVSQSYLDQTGQTREEAESEAQSSSGTYTIASSSGGKNATTNNSSGSFKLSKNKSHSDTSTSEDSYELSVNAKVTSEISASYAGIGAKVGAEIGTSEKDGYKDTVSGTNGWSKNIDFSREKSKTSVDESTWNSSSGYSNSNTTSRNTSISNAVSKLVSQQYGYGSSYAEGGSNSQSQSLASTDTSAKECSSSITYFNSKITTKTTSFSSTGNTHGNYRMVMAGTIHVFAVVCYDIAKQEYFVYTYNVLGDGSSGDDAPKEYLDYSWDGTFDDYETSIVPFEVPYYVNQYVNSRIAISDGLEIDLDTGIVTNYFANQSDPDTVVIIPSYVRVNNNDGTYSSVKIRGISPNLFKNNTDIVGVSLSSFIEEIPESAFEGCSSLREVLCPNVTKIGDNAFKGCTVLNMFTLPDDTESIGFNAFEGVPTVKADVSNTDVAQSVAACGANNIVLDISSIPRAEAVNMEFIVGDITSFELLGKDKEYKGLSVKSDAETTIINGVTFTENTKTPMEFSSNNVTLDRVSVDSTSYALVLSAENTDVKLNQNVTFTSTSGNAILCRSIMLSPLTTGIVGKMTLSGDILTAGTVAGEKYLNFNSGEIKYITDDEYTAYRSSCNITLDANGGSVSSPAVQVVYNTAVGELPTPAYGDYTFLGWYTEKNGGTRITPDTVISSIDMTLYAKWNNWDGNSSEPAYNAATKTYTITNGNELAWISDVSNGVITSGDNFPESISFNGYTIELANDIYLNDTTDWESWDDTVAPKNAWKPIGKNIGYRFNGTFNGNGYSINGIYINSPNIDMQGLFGYTQGTIENVGVTESYINGHYNVGGVAGYNAELGEIINCYNTGIISGSVYVGGVVGANCSGNISQIAIVRDCYNTGVITGTKYVGGVAGQNAYSLVSFCYNTGEIAGIGASNLVGGIVGTNEYKSTIEYCYNTGAVSGYRDVGGVAGDNSFGPTIEYCYNVGTISGNKYLGGIVGQVNGADKTAATIKYCYAIQSTLYNIFIDDYIIIRSVSQKTATQMKNLSNLSGFSTADWGTDPNINNGYPYLKSLKDSY